MRFKPRTLGGIKTTKAKLVCSNNALSHPARLSSFALAWVWIVTILAATGSAAGQTKPLLLGLHVNHDSSWPVQVDFDLWRTLDSPSGTMWKDIQTGPDSFDFSRFDQELQDAALANVEVMYTPIGVPGFIASPVGYMPNDDGPRTCACNYTVGGVNGCYPPKDINGDGSGTDATWQNFMIALATHVHSNHVQNPDKYADINYWESGNEFESDPQQWCGSFAQLARMMQDEKAIVNKINPAAKVMTVAMAWYNLSDDYAYLNTKANVSQAQTPAQLADIIDYHCYVYGYKRPEIVIATLAKLIQLAESIPAAAGKPISCSEGGWIKTAPATWTDAQNWLARYLLSVSSTGVIDFNLFMYDNYIGNTSVGPAALAALWAPSTKYYCSIPASPGDFCLPEISWSRVYDWLEGVTFQAPCTSQRVADGNIWLCEHTSSGQYQTGEFVWYDTLDQTREYRVPPGFTEEQDINGNITSIFPGQSISISNSPILLMSFGKR